MLFIRSVTVVHAMHPSVTVGRSQFSVPQALTERCRLLITWATAARYMSVVIVKKKIGKRVVTVLTWLVAVVQLVQSQIPAWLSIH